MLNSQEKILKAQKQVEKINTKTISKKIKAKQKRHVKEKNEPVLDEIIKDFRLDYANTVVGDSMKEIVKEIKDIV